jgi:hypothetical protein
LQEHKTHFGNTAEISNRSGEMLTAVATWSLPIGASTRSLDRREAFTRADVSN